MGQTGFHQWIYLFWFLPTEAPSTSCGCGCDGAGDATQKAKLKVIKMANTLKFIFGLLQR